jgi:hypothetical protein
MMREPMTDAQAATGRQRRKIPPLEPGRQRRTPLYDDYDWMDDDPAINAIFNRPTAMSSFVSEVADLPDLGDAQGSIVWKNTIQKHARKAATELSQFQTDLETRLRSVDELVLACAAIKNAAQYKLEGLTKLESIAASNSADIAANSAGMATLMLMINGLAETAKSHSSRLTAQDAAIASIAQAQTDLPQLVMMETLLAVDTSLTKHMTQVLAVVDGHLIPLKADLATLCTEMSRLTGEIPTIGTRVNEIHCAIAHRPPHVNFAAPPDVPSRPDEPVHDLNPPTSEDDANDTDRDDRAQSEATAQTVPNRRHPLFPNASPPPAGTTWTMLGFI